MPTLDEKYFANECDLREEHIARITVHGLGEQVNAVLTAHGWEGQLAASVGLTVSADGSAVSAALFLLLGELNPTPISIKANLLWRTAADVTLHIAPLTGQQFSFAGGSLCSDYVDHSAVQYHLSKSQQPIMPADYKAHKIGGFCLRTVAHLDKSSNGRAGPLIKLTTLVFPGSAAETLDSDGGAQSPSWPGFRALEAAAALFPRPPLGLWGAPILPLLAVHERAEACQAVPDGTTLRFAIAELMRTAALPTVCVSKPARATTIRSMQQIPENLEPRMPTITWPPANTPDPVEGKFRKCDQIKGYLIHRLGNNYHSVRFIAVQDIVKLPSRYKKQGFATLRLYSPKGGARTSLKKHYYIPQLA